MNKQELIKAIAVEAELTNEQAAAALDGFINIVGYSLTQGNEIKLVGFGTFKTSERKARTGRNPKTGEEIPITARRVVTFRPGQKLKARVEAYAGTKS